MGRWGGLRGISKQQKSSLSHFDLGDITARIAREEWAKRETRTGLQAVLQIRMVVCIGISGERSISRPSAGLPIFALLGLFISGASGPRPRPQHSKVQRASKLEQVRDHRQLLGTCPRSRATAAHAPPLPRY